MKKKILFSLALFFLAFATVSVVKTNAASITGWLWGGTEDGTVRTCTKGIDATDPACVDGNETGVGKISMSNVTGGGAIAYGVDIPSADGNLSGYAYSENIGYISFKEADLVGCPSAPCNARRIDNDIHGWARIMDIAQAGANAGGWLGWIKLRGTAQNGTPYGVSVSGNNLSGYGWSSGDTWTELGAIDFGGATLPVPPTVSLSANPSTILLESGESFTSLPPAEKNVTLTWTISGGSATSCTAECVLGDCGTWMTDTNKSTISGSTESVAVTSTVTDFKITCTGPGGSSSSTANVSSLCYEHSCAANACAESVKFGIADYATGCSVQACSSDTQCESRSTGEWREVAP